MVRKILKRLAFLICLNILFLLVATPISAKGYRQHIRHFKGTQHELNVYKIFGQKKGPTLMIIGGIQGDEPGGFLSADLYTDLSMNRGNLIVVPRANFYSILKFQRGANGDMNRKFGGKSKKDRDSKIVEVLKSLIAESDFLLNLHDGYGYFRPTYESKMANPSRFGQSIIADSREYFSEKLGRTIYLEETASQVIKVINAQIENPKYHFHFMNTRTGDDSSAHKEQRLSATYYALTKHGIPAFGVETSKNLPTIEMKVRHHNLAINAFMRYFGLEPEQPGVNLLPPKLKYMVVSVNNRIPVAVRDRETLHINRGDTIEVVHVEANYERGLSADVSGLGARNDLQRSLVINKRVSITAQKDHIKFGKVFVDFLKPASKPASPAWTDFKQKPQARKPMIGFFILNIEGKNRFIATGERLDVYEGDIIKLVDVISRSGYPTRRLAMNFKGFVPKGRKNNGRDRGFNINTATDLMPRWSLSKKEKIFAIVAEDGSRAVARMTVRIKKPELSYLILKLSDGPALCIYNGESVSMEAGQKLRVLDYKTNIDSRRRVKIILKNGATIIKPQNSPPNTWTFDTSGQKEMNLLMTRDGIVLGKIRINADR